MPGGSDIRVGLIGFGLGGATFHAPLIATTKGMRLAAVVTSDPGRRAQAERDHPGVSVVPSADALWERAGELDLIVVTTPNRTHVPLATAALEHGLHVVADKPFAPTATEGQRLVDEARRRGRVIVPFHNRRWDGDARTLRRLLDEGALGEVHRFESRYERWRAVRKPRWCEPDAHANAEGIIYDLGTHLVDQALWLFGHVTHVYAETDRRHPDVTVEDDAFLALTHASGVRSHLHARMNAAQLGPRMNVLGSRAAWVKYGMDPQEEALKAGGRPGAPAWGEEPNDQWGRLGAGDDVRPVRTEPGAYPRFYEGVVRAARDGAPPPVAPEDAVAGLAVIDAAYRSAADGRVAAVER
ncbi:MAG TPA: Gfo/Idh/MocA family oxidoreductase [Gemmatimonadaceae bacterium]|nr:Gfo/Idh/MocA family oxidoreductase [Gemmatimonadaceae bacterium]